jgi:transcriptional regulator with XRE-family HTH domain
MNNLFKENLKYLRKENGKSQSEIGFQLNKKGNTIGYWEAGSFEPSMSELEIIAQIFDISLPDLLYTDLSNVHLNKNMVEEEQAEYVHLIVHPNVHLNTKKAPKGACQACIVKDNYIAGKEDQLRDKLALIESQQTTIKLLQNELDRMKFDIEKRHETQSTQQQEEKTA